MLEKIKNYLTSFNKISNNIPKNNDVKKIIGLDINDYSISFVLLTGTNINNIKLLDYGFQIIPQNLVKNRFVVDLEKIVVILQNFLIKIKHITKDCILTLPYNSVTTTYFLKQFNSQIDIYELALNEVQKIASLDDVNFDICNINDVDENGNERILLALAKKEYVDERIYLAEELNLNLLCLDAFSTNIFNNNMFFLKKQLPSYLNKTFCILFIDANISSIKFFHHEKRISTSTIELDIEHVFLELQSKFNLSYEDTVQFILNKKVIKDKEYNDYIVSILKNISNQVEKAINIFELTRSDDQDEVGVILINVFGDLFHDLPKFIFERTGIKSVIPLSINQIECTREIEQPYYNNLNIAFGLALRGFCEEDKLY